MGNLTTFSLGNDESRTGGVAAPGDYHLSVVSAEVKTSKSGNQYVSVQFRIEDDQPFANLRIFEIYSLEGNEIAVKIGRSAMAKLGKLNGVDNVTDTQQLIGAHVYGTVVIEKNEGYSDRNRLRKFEDLRGRKNLLSKGSSDQAPDATFG